MNNLKEYILEKFKIHKGIDTTDTIDLNKVAIKICKLCGLEHDVNSNYLNAIKNWVKDNDIDNFQAICDKTVLSHKIPRSELLKDFINNPSYIKKICNDLIIDGQGKEVLGKSWADPKIYYNKVALIFHEHTNLLGNINRVFIKLNN